jgi:LysR family transcriptional activator of nhaA
MIEKYEQLEGAMLNYKHLHYFVSIARSGGVTRAAERLHLTPQTLSGQISQFEERLGVALFRRVGRRLELTKRANWRSPTPRKSSRPGPSWKTC